MLKLNKIIRKGNIVSATVTTDEHPPCVFDIEVNVVTRKLTKNTLGEMNTYVSMARNKLFKLVIEYPQNLPKEAVSVWY